MHRTALLFTAICFVLMIAASAFMASRAVDFIERDTQAQVDTGLRAAGQDWATIRADGLIVHLTGLAPDEASRFRALEIMGEVVDTGRIEDRTTVLKSAALTTPRFTLEVLRNVDRISLIGLIPERVGRDFILDRALKIADGGTVTDMLESAEHRVPSGWARNLDFGLESLERLPRSKISITSEQVRITAVTESQEEQTRVEQALAASKPDGLTLVMDISAPRPVIAPFRFRMTLDEGDVKLLACSADTRATRDRILRAVAKAGLSEKGKCDIGLGVPTTEWDQAVVQAVEALSALGGGTLTFADSDISFVATDQVSQSRFDQVIGKLENGLPDLFSLQAVLPPKILLDGKKADAVAPEFVATRSPEGQVQLSGRVPNALSKKSIGLFADSLFGKTAVQNRMHIDPNLPDGWPSRVMASLEGLEQLHHGSVLVQPETVEIKGVSGNPDVSSYLTGLFSNLIGDAKGYKISVRHDPKLIKRTDKISARECEAEIRAVLTDSQIQFSPSSTTIEAASQGVLDAIAEILRDCPDTEFEIEGHTDSQGSDELNRNLSQQRAEAVLSALLARRVLISSLSAKGYGEDQPIADNSTEEGRAQNRRIAFRLVSEPVKDTQAEKPED